jgi:prepilin-type N-terminal cleavage/methylation domain-containing protein
MLLNMMFLHDKKAGSRHWRRPIRSRGFTLPEVVMAIGILALCLGGIITGYVFSSKRVEWSAYSLAAQSMALQRLEQARACKWDLGAYPIVDNQLQSSNFPQQVLVLDIPMNSTNGILATNITEVIDIQTNYPPIKLVRVTCRWPFINGKTYTNSIASYVIPSALGE